MANPTDPEKTRRDDQGPPDEAGSDPAAAAPAPADGEPAAPAPAPAPEPDYRDRWLRAEAELQNFRRRARRELEEGQRAAEERVFLEMIAALDDLERALRAEEPAGSEGWRRGVELTARRLREYLSQQGVSELDPLGKPFDPSFHEAVLEVEPPKGRTPGSVVEVVLKGYARAGRALRAARVVVARPEPRQGGDEA